MQAFERHARSSRWSEASHASLTVIERTIPAFRDRSVLLTTLAIMGAVGGLLIAALLSRDPREAGAYTVACLMIGGAIAIGLRGREVEPRLDPLAEAQQQMRAVAHDLKAPLLTVTSYLELIADGAFGTVSDDVRAAITRAAAVSERAQTVITSTLRAEAGVIAGADAGADLRIRVDLNRILSDVLGALNCAMRERHATVAVEGRLPVVLGDDASLFRVLENLVQNSIKFCADDTVPQIGIRSRRIDSATFEVTISDNGPGMPGDADGLILRGERGDNATGTAGHGIGLATVARLVTRMGGTVRFEGVPERGTVVRLTLPAA